MGKYIDEIINGLPKEQAEFLERLLRRVAGIKPRRNGDFYRGENADVLVFLVWGLQNL